MEIKEFKTINISKHYEDYISVNGIKTMTT